MLDDLKETVHEYPNYKEQLEYHKKCYEDDLRKNPGENEKERREELDMFNKLLKEENERNVLDRENISEDSEPMSSWLDDVDF